MDETELRHYEWLRWSLANNYSFDIFMLADGRVPEEILLDWSSDRNVNIRRFVAGQTSNIEILTKYSVDTEPGVRWELTGNENTPIDLLLKLACDKNMQVRECALERL